MGEGNPYKFIKDLKDLTKSHEHVSEPSLEKIIITTATFDTDGVKFGDSLRVYGRRKRWFVRLWHFVTFNKFNKEIYTVTSVDSDTTLTIEI